MRGSRFGFFSNPELEGHLLRFGLVLGGSWQVLGGDLYPVTTEPETVWFLSDRQPGRGEGNPAEGPGGGAAGTAARLRGGSIG